MILVLSLFHRFLVSKKSSFGLIISIWNYHNIYFTQPTENTVGNNPKQLTKPQVTLQHLSLLESYLSEIAFVHRGGFTLDLCGLTLNLRLHLVNKSILYGQRCIGTHNMASLGFALWSKLCGGNRYTVGVFNLTA